MFVWLVGLKKKKRVKFIELGKKITDENLINVKVTVSGNEGRMYYENAFSLCLFIRLENMAKGISLKYK